MLKLPVHRIVLDHDGALTGTPAGDAQSRAQNAQIVAFARQRAGPHDRQLGIEVFYRRLDAPANSTTEADFDAVLVLLDPGEIAGTYPPYDSLDPDWRTQRGEL